MTNNESSNDIEINTDADMEKFELQEGNLTNNKYFKQIEINGQITTGYVDFGSSCTIIKTAEAEKLGLPHYPGKSILCGYGNGRVESIGSTAMELKIDFVKATVKAIIVRDTDQKIPVLVGRNFTELPQIFVMKDKEQLIFHNATDEKATEILGKYCLEPPLVKIKLQPTKDCIVYKNHVGMVKVCGDGYVGDVYIEASLRCEEGKEMCIPNIVSQINREGQAILPIINLSGNDIIISKKRVIARAWPCEELATPSEEVLRVQEDCPTPLNREDINMGPITEKEKEQLYALLTKYRDCIAQTVGELGSVKFDGMEIRLKDDTPFTYRPYRMAKSEQDKVTEIVTELLEAGIIRGSKSEYSSPVVLVKKKNGEPRMCIDYRKLNSLTVQDNYPLPRIDDQVDRLRDGIYFTSLDLKSGYHQIPMKEDCKKYTAFTTPSGLYEFNRMPFGLTNAPRCFQRLINKILSPLGEIAAIYLDDVMLHARTVSEAIQDLEEVLKIFRAEGLTLNLKKCQFLLTTIEFLGFEIGKNTVRPGTVKTKAIENFPTPTSVRNVRQFLGLTGYFRQFVKNYAFFAKPLTRLIRKDVVWEWTEKERQAFEKLKDALTNRPVLAIYSPEATTELHTDASSIGVAGILLQRQEDNKLHPIAYYSRQTSDTESKFHSYELETLAVVESLKKFRVYLIGINFSVVTDCNALKATKEKKELIPRIARWWLQIQEFTFNVRYRPGSRMKHVDALSRNPENQQVTEVVMHVSQADWVLAGQLTDAKIKQIYEILSRSPITNFEKDVYKNYALREGRVYRITARGIQWLVPRGMRNQVVKAAHDDLGHFGIEKTLYRLCEHYWFPRMRQYVEKYIACCIQCLFNKRKSGKKEGFLNPIPKGAEPMKVVHIDHLGPFPKTKKNNCYILVTIDPFTKFSFLRAVKTTKTKYVIHALKDIFSTYGIPRNIISDQGSAFTSKEFSNFCTRNNIHHIRNAVATPRANGQVERLNRSILNSLMATNLEEELWDEDIRKVQFALNNVPNKTTGKTPSELMFGYKPRGSSDVLLSDEVSCAKQILEDLMEERERISTRIVEQQKIQKQQFDRKRKRAREYKEGDIVLLEKFEPATNTSRKLVAPYSGPFIVKTVLPNDRYIVTDMKGSLRTSRKPSYDRTVAADRMKPWQQPGGVSDETDSNSGEDDVVVSEPESDQPETC